jgi:hypothetical protein
MRIQPDLKKDALAIRLGKKHSGKLSYSTRQAIERMSRQVETLITPRLYFSIVNVSHQSKGSIVLEDGTRFESVRLSRTLNHCPHIVCFALTIGKIIDRQISSLSQKGRLSQAYILDVMGSLMAENMVEQFWRKMRLKYQSEGRGVSLRFSPGYCDWPLSEQEKLFRFIDADKLSLTLSNHFLMSPRKSISGVFGISAPSHARSVSSYNPCGECGKKSCRERRSLDP